MSERIDTLPTRMFDVIDALPVPAGPGGLRPRARLILRPRLDPVTVLVLLALALAAVMATPVGRAAVSEAGRLIERIFGLGPWPAYYGRLTTDAEGLQVEQLMFWDGASPGRSTGIGSGAGYRGGWWSTDGSAFVVAVGSLIYVGDRSGVMREVANVAPLRVTQVDWIGPDRIVALGRAGDSDWLISVERDGNITRERLPEDARPARQLGLLGVADPGGVAPPRKFSPEGRWLITGDDPCRSVAVYDLALDRRIEIADGVETKGVALGWLRGSVLVWATCDVSAGTLHIRAGAPDAVPTDIGSISFDLTDLMTAVRLDRAHDRILFPGKAGDDLVVWALSLDGQQTELMRLRASSTFGALDPIGVSRDGRLLAFNAVALGNLLPIQPERGNRGFYAETLARAGVIDLYTGEIKWACETDCARIRLR